MIFTLLNLLAGLVTMQTYNGKVVGLAAFIRNIPSTYLSGNGRAAVFEVLLPIGYLLVFCTPIVAASKWSKYFLHGTCAVFLLGDFFLDQAGYPSANLRLFVFGLLGLVAGLIPLSRINAWAARLVALTAAYVGYVCVITFWGECYFLQCAGVCLTLLLIYGIGVAWGGDGLAQRCVILLGQYSLAGYLAQIALLQFLRRLLRHAGRQEGEFLVVLSVALVLTIVAIVALDRSRSRWRAANLLYTLAFS